MGSEMCIRDRFRLGDVELDVIGLVGHTRGSIALRLHGNPSDHVLTGDSLFPGRLGKTSGSREFESLYTDVCMKIFAPASDTTVIHPGHGDATTVGEERPNLPLWRARGW